MREIERYVSEVLQSIEATPRERRRVAADLRAHLQEAVRAGESVERAIARMGSPAEVAAAFRAQVPRPYARPWRRLILLLAPLAVVYALGTAYLLLGWLGLQSLPDTWRQDSLSFYALACTLGAAGAIALVLWRRWGAYALGAAWALTALLNLIYPRPVQLGTRLAGLLVAAVVGLGVWRVWRYLE